VRRHGLVSAAVHNELRDAYDFLRTVEDRLRLIHNRGASELPETPVDLQRLARRLSDENVEPGRAVETFLAEAARVTHRTRELFEQIVAADAGPARDQ
jgi:[glutamine synthetase] adenylyltransferase / [glutamine synthetase]-adenylyl-L-tyrosine phosphorylase